MALPNASHAIIDPRKLTSHALNPGHPIGGNKARVFQSVLGFTARDAALLVERIQSGVLENPASRGVTNVHGTLYTVDISITGPNGSGVIRTAWIVEPGAMGPRLITLYVK